jgi:hypothetical protein
MGSCTRAQAADPALGLHFPDLAVAGNETARRGSAAGGALGA